MAQSDSQDERTIVSLRELQQTVRGFAEVRNWLRFHNPRNVAEAIVVEAAELLECFQWRSDDNCLRENLDDSTVQAIQSELADVLIYALNLANALNIDAGEVIQSKLDQNAIRFPLLPSDE